MQLHEITVSSGGAAGRRHDVDWLRVCALGLLIVYHAVISFQPSAYMILISASPSVCEAKTIRVPSGDQAGSKSFATFDVSWVRFEPSMSTRNIS